MSLFPGSNVTEKHLVIVQLKMQDYKKFPSQASLKALFYADDVALLSASAQGLQQLLDSMQSFCAANGLTISIPKTEVVVFG